MGYSANGSGCSVPESNCSRNYFRRRLKIFCKTRTAIVPPAIQPGSTHEPPLFSHTHTLMNALRPYACAHAPHRRRPGQTHARTHATHPPETRSSNKDSESTHINTLPQSARNTEMVSTCHVNLLLSTPAAFHMHHAAPSILRLLFLSHSSLKLSTSHLAPSFGRFSTKKKRRPKLQLAGQE